MKEEKTTPLRQRMIEDMRIRGMAEKTQAAHIRAVKDFSIFLKRSPDSATPEDLRTYQLQMTNAGMTPTTGSNSLEKACEKPPPATQALTCQPKPDSMKPSVKPAAHLRVE